MNKETTLKALKSAAWIALPGALISLIVCTLMLGSGLFEMLLPVWLTILFTAVCIALEFIPFVRKRIWLKITVLVVLVAAAAICLHLL